jgi:hypothetical protein
MNRELADALTDYWSGKEPDGVFVTNGSSQHAPKFYVVETILGIDSGLNADQ